jgi:hypothetical protein
MRAARAGFHPFEKTQTEELLGNSVRYAIAFRAGSTAGCPSSFTRAAASSGSLPPLNQCARTGLHGDEGSFKNEGTGVLRDGSELPLVGDVGWARVDATAEDEIATQIRMTPRQGAMPPPTPAASGARSACLGVAFARRLAVPIDTLRNWEQGEFAAETRPGVAAHHRPRPRGGLHALDRTSPGPAASIDPGCSDATAGNGCAGQPLGSA